MLGKMGGETKTRQRRTGGIKELEGRIEELQRTIGRLKREAARRDRGGGEDDGRYRAIVREAPDAVFVTDRGGTIVDASRKAGELLGCTAEELSGKEFPTLLSGEARSGTTRAYGKSGRRCTLEASALRKDGSAVAVTVSFTPVRYGGGRVFLVVVRDITGRKRLEEALTLSEKQYRDMFENIPIGIWRTSPEGRVLAVNPFTARLMGFDSPESMIRSVEDIGRQLYRNPKDRRAMARLLKKRGYVRDYEAAFARQDGSTGWCVMNARAVRNARGEILYYEGSFQDITDRKKAEEALLKNRAELEARVAERTRTLTAEIEEHRRIEESLRKMAFVVNSARELMTLANRDYVYEAVNDAYCRAVGMAREEIVGRSMAEMWGRRRFAAFIKPKMDRCLSGETVRDEDWIVFPNLGRRCFAIGYYPYSQTGGKTTHVSVITHDITERKIAEEDLKEHEEAMHRRALELEEANTALRVFFKRHAEDQKKIEEKIVYNVNELVVPYVRKLRQYNLGKQCMTYLDLLEANLQNIVSPFMQNLAAAYRKLTPQEIQVAEMVRQGKSSQEMASILNIALGTVKTHRNNLRRKLDLRNRGVNLQSHLLTLA